MPIVKVKDKFQVTLPSAVREQAGLAVGDLLDARIEKGKITLTPKTLIDRRIEESLEDFKRGRNYGPFDSAAALVASLQRRSARKKTRKATKRP
jgi:AbrB family looped-hinge helix DNA binding protein